MSFGCYAKLRVVAQLKRLLVMLNLQCPVILLSAGLSQHIAN
jgi:hypothetical protein